MKQNVFVIGLDDFHRRQLATIGAADEYEFIGVLERAEVDGAARYPMPETMERVLAKIRQDGRPVHAVVGHFDFPVSTMLPLVQRAFGLSGPTLESVLKCEHKYWSRLEQQVRIPEHIPGFAVFDPFSENEQALRRLGLPLWIKPVKSLGSYLGFRVRSRAQFHASLDAIRERIGRIGDPFTYLMGRAEVPEAVAQVDGRHCIAERTIGGRQCTLEGYVHNGEVTVYGVVDSIRHANQTSFGRYQYPSLLPEAIQRQMIDAARTVMQGIGFDHSPFNIEFFHDARRNRIWLLEINPRISQSHCPLFQMVDGASNQQVMVEVAMGRDPDFPCRQGRFPFAGKFMIRKYGDAVVVAAPGERAIAAVREEFPEALVQISVTAGTRLSRMHDQDSYTYELGLIYLGGQTPRELLRKYARCLELLDFEFDDGGRPI